MRKFYVVTLLFMMSLFAHAQEIVQFEYFFDSDPGFGQGLPVTITPSSDLDLVFTADMNGLEDGWHKLFLRGKDNSGRWSLNGLRYIYKQDNIIINPIPDIVQFEYFFDTDPGFGHGSSVTISPGNQIIFDFTADMNGLNDGWHKLFIRGKDSNDCWSLSGLRHIYKQDPSSIESAPDLVKIEYFFDEDPGQGQGYVVDVSAGSELVFDFTADLSSLELGWHRLFVRGQDANSRWSLVQTRMFYMDEMEPLPEIDIVRIDYRIVDDSGEEVVSNSYDTFNAATSIDEHFLIDCSTLELAGDYTIEIAGVDENGVKSLSQFNTFTVIQDQTPPSTPQNLTVEVQQGYTHLSWARNPETDCKEYRIYRGSMPNPTNLLATVSTSADVDTAFLDYDIIAENTYFYRITAVDYDLNESDPTEDLSITPFWGPVWYVSTTGSNESGTGSESNPFATIQTGIESAYENDTVLVSSGTYQGNIVWPETNGIKLISAGNVSNTIIDGGENGSVINIDPQTVTIDTSTLIQGFKITNGGNAQYGGGIFINNSSPILNDLVVVDNSATNGGGIYVAEGNPQFSDLIVSNNTASLDGGGIYGDGSPTYENVFVCNNSAGRNGGGIAGGGSYTGLSVINNYAGGNGGGMYLGATEPQVLFNNTICHNVSTLNTDGIYFEDGGWDVSSSNILANGIGIYNLDNSELTDATDNYWGSASGPYHPDQNSNGQGDSTNQWVNVSPWLTTPNSDAPPIPMQGSLVSGKNL